MATEILGFLIIVGILIVFILRRDAWNGNASKADEVEEASVKMRLQMEHSANAIITQMDSRIHQLEGLVAAADERARMLEQQMAAVRADQERVQQQAEKAFAEMRAAQASFYAPQPEMAAPGHRGDMYGEVPHPYRTRASAGRSLRPVEGVSPVRRPAQVPQMPSERRGVGPDFAETLSASMVAAEAMNGGYRGAASGYYGNGQPFASGPAYPQSGRHAQDAAYAREAAHDARVYGENYGASYPVEMYPEEETWEPYAEQPRRAATPQGTARLRRAPSVPVEMAVEESPAVIVDSKMMTRQEAYAQDESEDEAPAFSQAQLEELARTEAEVVVSSSVADVVDLPMASEGNGHLYDGEEEEDIHAIAAPEAGDPDSIFLTRPEGELHPAEESEWPETEESPSGRLAAGELLAADAPEETGAEEGDARQTGGPENADFASEEEPGQSASPETQAGNEEMPADAMDESPDGEEYDAPESAKSESFGEDTGPRPSSPTARAKELLAQGMAPGDVAKETGMGRSAVELLAQMTHGQLNAAMPSGIYPHD